MLVIRWKPGVGVGGVNIGGWGYWLSNRHVVNRVGGVTYNGGGVWFGGGGGE